ncbi:MAG: bifunctional histidinol-phosphatase/imidazoleglycerol-phosphate dehydratase HisB [Bacteroidales bacterium]|nr:bifunctional histidinol-phosphatase/imidazoleglycerol-phosphate dehydratase HisB [Bacteroidales bacterium]
MSLKKALFIDRDGTIIVEPQPSEQVDSFEKFEFVPGAISALKSIAGLDYELVLATNQDGLGTQSFPYEDFIGPQDLMLRTLAGEGVVFDDILIDRSFPADNLPTRKPGTGMFGKYLSGEYDLAASYVIGDRATDAQLAANLGCRAILLDEKNTWAEIAEVLRRGERRATVNRNTKETQITVTVDLDGGIESRISTGLNFFDHMLDQIAHHSGVGLQIEAKGDLQVDEHHTMEDVAIALGEALKQALGSKRGIGRYGFALPMDECEAMVLLDLGGRIDFGWEVPFTREYVGDTPTEMFRHFYKSLCEALQCNLHIRARGENNHHLAEGVFKAFARALRQAVACNPFDYEIPTSKGLL